MTKTKLVLWDIDHTLIETGGIGREVFAEAFEQVTGHQMDRMAEVAGRTEPDIFRETLVLHGIEDPGDYFDRFATTQAEGYERRADAMRQHGRTLDGVAAALAAVAEYDAVIQSVLTGNTRAAAEVKLRVFDLAAYLDFEIGAYGSEDSHRANLVRVARRRATDKYGTAFDSVATILIGDTPKDVEAAHEGGAQVIAVASGTSTVEELSMAAANLVLADLTDTDALITGIMDSP